MAVETFRDKARFILTNLLNEAPQIDREQLIDAYADILTQLHATEAHGLLTEVIEDTRTRLDARLSPDPLRQTIASVQTTMQDLWRSLWRE
jgi:hypothetical protein